MATFTVPQEYGYVIATTAATFFLGMWHGARIGPFRKEAGIKYPQYYAEKSDLSAASPETKKAMYRFNCAQRAHGNYLENQPSVVAAMLITGIQYPMVTTGLGVGWVVSRIIFALGYTKKDGTDGKGRLYGAAFWLCQLGLFGLAGYQGIKMVM